MVGQNAVFVKYEIPVVTVSDLSVLSLRGLINHYDANPDRDFNISAQGRDACGPDKAGSPALK